MSDLEGIVKFAEFACVACVFTAITIPLIGTYVPKFILYVDTTRERKRIKKCIENEEPPFEDGQLYLPFKDFY